ncbi:hypothetical protein PBY51_011142 [Eleginops maclovinus]|uniref:Ig-like domain-containing protein n=1 Tax=Eleginops maclovinus TaxID=56733 RepID=A0AAN8AJY8_ELEMC|nr:hypothetical protein PBY51_011142 [Eleginops maclovinus]
MLLTVLQLALLLHSGLTAMVLQPRDQTSRPGSKVTFECSMSDGNSMSGYTMFWYRQDRPGAPLQYLLNEFDNTAGRLDSSIEPSKNVFSLHISELQLEDSSTYYCAAKHSAAPGAETRTDNRQVERRQEGAGLISFYTEMCDTGAEAYFGKGTKLTVLEKDHEVTEPTVTVFRPSRKECSDEGDGVKKKTLVCVASGFYPDHVSVSWHVDGKSVSSGVATDSTALREDKTYRISSRLRVLAKDWFTPEKDFTCNVTFFNGTAYSSHIASDLRNESLILSGEQTEMNREGYLKKAQAVKLYYGIFIVKSSFYGAGVALLLWKLKGSAGKQN